MDNRIINRRKIRAGNIQWSRQYDTLKVMKKMILLGIPHVSILFFAVVASLVLSPKAFAQINVDCQATYDKELYKCLTDSTKCINSCVDKAEQAASLTVDGGKVNLECRGGICDPAKAACDKEALDSYEACLSGPLDEPLTVEQANALQSALDELGGFFEEMILHSVGKRTIAENDAEAVKAREAIFGADWQKMVEREMKITEEAEKKAQQTKAPEGTVINVIGTGDTRWYSWNNNSGAVIKSDVWEKIEFREPIEIDGFTTRVVEFSEGEVEVKVRNENPAENKFGVDAGWFEVTVSRTHFWVSKDPSKKLAIVGVYEGEVEVKTSDGKTVKVTPDGGNPGVMVIERRLSPVRLAIGIGATMAIIGGGVLILRKRKSSNLKKKR